MLTGCSYEVAEMPIPPKYDSLKYRIDDLRRKAENVKTLVTWEAVNQFALVGYHMCDWIEEDTTISTDMKNEAKALRARVELEACRCLANEFKHRRLSKPSRFPPQMKQQSVSQGYGVGRYGKGLYGHGEERIEITMLDGTEFNALELVDRTVELWVTFFTKYGLRWR